MLFVSWNRRRSKPNPMIVVESLQTFKKDLDPQLYTCDPNAMATWLNKMDAWDWKEVMRTEFVAVSVVFGGLGGLPLVDVKLDQGAVETSFLAAAPLDTFGNDLPPSICAPLGLEPGALCTMVRLTLVDVRDLDKDEGPLSSLRVVGQSLAPLAAFLSTTSDVSLDVFTPGVWCYTAVLGAIEHLDFTLVGICRAPSRWDVPLAFRPTSCHGGPRYR